MTVATTNNREIIPGYRLLEKLGHGGFGEVWKAEAPGGLLKAIKIVYGNLGGLETEGGRARQELKSLDRVKSIRHPYLLSLDRVDVVDGQLVIVMELADKDLMDRFKRCCGKKLPGIPRDELLRYIYEAAEALDLMNMEHQLQHLDIKPQNLLLVYNHVKIADFGLVKTLEGLRTTMTSRSTALYAPPETFDGLASHFSDQYSLAIVYQEMLTGTVPFSGTSGQLMLQHMSAVPNLEPLPPGDRPAIARALSKKPEDRFPTCHDLFMALHQATAGGSTPSLLCEPGSRAEPEGPSLLAETTATPSAMPALATSTPATSASSTPAGTPAPGTSVSRTPTPDTPASRTPAPYTPPVATPVPHGTAHPITETPDTATPFSRSAGSSASGLSMPATPLLFTQPQAPVRKPTLGDGVLFPALVLGVGGVGREIMRQLRKSLQKRCGPLDALPHIRFLLLDTDPDELREARRAHVDTAFSDSETLLARLQRPAHYLKSGPERQALERWLPAHQLSRLPREQTTPLGWRMLGRLAFNSNFAAIAGRLTSELAACVAPDALKTAQRRTGLGLRSDFPRVYIIASLGGGSGGGMFLDLAYLLRHLLQRLGYADADVVGVLPLPAADRSGSRRRDVANAFAALSELNYFSAPHTVFSGGCSDAGMAFTDTRSPFDRCVLLSLATRENSASLPELAALAGDVLGRELTTPLGKVAQEERDRRLGKTVQPRCLTLGSYWFTVPRRLLLQRVARSLCQRLVQSWRDADARLTEKNIRQWTATQLERHQLDLGALTNGLQSAAAGSGGLTAEQSLKAALAQFGPRQPADICRRPELAVQAIKGVMDMVGPPETGPSQPATPVGTALAEAVAPLSDALEPRLAELVARVLAEPHFRFLGLEEVVQGRLCAGFAEHAKAHRDRAERSFSFAAQLGAQLPPLLEALRRRLWWDSWSRTGRAADLLAVLYEYGATRAEALSHQALSVLFGELHERFKRYVRNVDCCRPRIVDFLQSFAESAGASQPHVDLGLGQYLLPGGCRTLPEAVERILDRITPAEAEEINGRVQALIGRNFETQMHICTAPAAYFRDLEEEILKEVLTFAEAPLGRAHAAEMYLEQRSGDDSITTELANAFDEAVPELAGAGLDTANELRILAVPPGSEGAYFRSLVQRALPEQDFIAAPSTDDIVFYREVPVPDLTALPQLSPAARETYRHFMDADQPTPHSRIDIADWSA